MSGWIAVTRASFDHPIFKREPVTEWEAFMRLVKRAAHSETRHRVGGELHPVERGTFFCTLRELQLEFMWRSDARVRKFLERLENERMIERKTNAGKTHVTICNYDEYQQGERKKNAKRTQAGTQDERKTNALKNNVTINKDLGGGAREAFEDFWKAYPHRGGAKKAKAPARKSFESAIRSGATPSQIISAAHQLHQDRQTVRGYAPNPATWLNQRRWEDEIEPTSPPKGGAHAPGKTDRLQRIISAAAAGTSGEDWPAGGGDTESVLAGGHPRRREGAGPGELDGPSAEPDPSGNQGGVAVLPVGPAEPHGHGGAAATGPGAARSDCAGQAPEAHAGFGYRSAYG